MGLFSRKDGGRRPGFMSGVMDEVHGAHMSGTTMELWPEIRRIELAMVIAGADSVASDKGEYRLLYQPSRTFGSPQGPLLVSADTVDRDLALAVCSKRGLTGYLSVYTPYRDDAESLMFDATGGIPVEHASCRGYLGACMGNFRGSPGDEGLPGPMCCFGEFHLPETDDPDVSRRNADETDGFHAEGRRVVLAPDLGGSQLDASDQGREALDRAEEGRFYAVIVPEGGEPSLCPDPIDRGLALRICMCWSRSGTLSVYTPLRSDAEALASEASRGSPRHFSGRGRGLPGFEPRPYGQSAGPVVLYRG